MMSGQKPVTRVSVEGGKGACGVQSLHFNVPETAHQALSSSQDKSASRTINTILYWYVFNIIFYEVQICDVF